ncbi:MAG: hypothetical protein Q7J57_16860 [Gemmobacter sp.]|nr:hypothetical protein [Gemmobacter sp.]
MIERNSAKSDLNALSSPHESAAPTQLDLAMDRIKEILSDGLKHGFFDCNITAAIGTNHRREMIVQSGKSHKFIIPLEELSR